MTTEVTTPVGRLVSGHPMVSHVQTDDRTGQPRIGKDNQPLVTFYAGIAIPKGTEASWKDTPWGQIFVNEARAGWPNGEWQSPSFAWKVTDGDSTIPNKKGKKPCDQEGYPRHWIINCSNGFPIKCYNRGQYEAHQVLQRKEAIKRGDYCRIMFDVVANNPSESPGVYVNPFMFELYQAGVEIVGGERDAAAAFAEPAALPAGAMVDHNVPPPAQNQTPPPPAYTPAPEVLTPPPPASRLLNGVAYSETSLLAGGWQQAAIDALPKA